MDKPKLTMVNREELIELREKSGELSTPMVHVIGDACYVDTDELRAWRASQSTSDGEQKC